jgi:predicted ArsR family transcriptional regulator
MNNKNKITQWINVILNEISKLDGNKGIELLHLCGGECSKTSLILEGAAKIRNEYINDNDPDKLFDAFKMQYYNTSRFRKEGNKIILIFEECTCPLVKEGVSNSYLCNCTTGYTKKIFETLFNKTIKVDLEQSILKGNKICKQNIKIEG